MPDPAHAVRDQRREEGNRGDRHQDDHGEDVEAQLRPAVGLLVEAQAERRGGDHDSGHDDQADCQPEERAGPIVGQALGPDHQPARKEGHRRELEEAASRVLGIADAGRLEGVEAAEQIGALKADEEHEHGDYGGEDRDRLGRADPPTAGRRNVTCPLILVLGGRDYTETKDIDNGEIFGE